MFKTTQLICFHSCCYNDYVLLNGLICCCFSFEECQYKKDNIYEFKQKDSELWLTKRQK